MADKSTREVVVSGAASALLNHVTVGPHAFDADEPPEAGGGDAGPLPFELLCASLGACTSMTLAIYAKSRGIPLEHVTVRLVHTRVQAPGEGQRPNRIDKQIELHGDLTQEQRAKLLEIAAKCPVHKALTQGLDLRSVLVD